MVRLRSIVVQARTYSAKTCARTGRRHAGCVRLAGRAVRHFSPHPHNRPIFHSTPGKEHDHASRQPHFYDERL
jgi:hypothetical protein